jgi:hypothetical protein
MFASFKDFLHDDFKSLACRFLNGEFIGRPDFLWYGHFLLPSDTEPSADLNLYDLYFKSVFF